MASAYPPSSASSALPHRSAAFKSPVPTSNAPQGTFLPGTKVQVGSHRVTIEKYLSEGGFAHVYVVRVPRDGNKHELAVLKRVAVPDREHLANMRTEVETMKKVKGHKHVVLYMDSHASQLKGGGYEVFLLMEYCAGGGLIDFMNTRLQHRLTEPEILKIFGDCAEGVACMHYLKPPLLHRDLKVENVLIAKHASSGSPVYKICDFGSTAPPRPAAKTPEEGRLIEEDVQKHTTMQYRSPEMVDVWRKQPIDEKSDIWALGVLLYKLCYYTTPFEDRGQMAILNASYKYPPQPVFSERLKKLIALLLKEDPKNRPNIYQVIKEVSSMRGTEVPIKDIYAGRTQSEARRNETLPGPEPPMSVGLQKETPQVKAQSIPDIAPMRRGRPSAPATQAAKAASKPSPSPAKGDPFAALDSKNYEVRAGAVDELSKRFPSVDEFDIAHDKGSPFQFSSKPPAQPADLKTQALNERVANALADEVFSSTSPNPADVPKSQSTTQLQPKALPQKSASVSTRVRETSQQSPLMHQPTPIKPAKYTSTGVGSSPPNSATQRQFPEISSKPIWKVPDHHRSSSQPRASDSAQAAASSLKPSAPPTQRPALLDMHRSKSQTATLTASKSPTSSRPSLEGHRPSQMDLGDEGLSRARSAQSRPRPTSVYVSSNLDYLRDQESSKKRPSMEARRHSRQGSVTPAREENVVDDMDYLRSNEAEEKISNHRKMIGGGHKKRSSLASISDGAKSMFAGKFGDAFKRFEHVGSPSEQPAEKEVMQANDLRRPDEYDPPRLLSPVQGSEDARSKASYPSDVDSDALDETEDLPPDMRREMERRRLSQEEKRVAEAAAEYRERGPGAVPTRASTIQKRVQSLLDEGRQSPIPSKRTAEGYGRFTSTSEDVPASTSPSKAAPPPLARKPMPNTAGSNNLYPKTRPPASDPPAPVLPIPPASAPPTQTQISPSQPQPLRAVSRPSVPPKSSALRTGGAKPQWPPPSSSSSSSAQQQTETPAPAPPKPSGALAALLAKDLEGVPEYPGQNSSSANLTRGAREEDVPDLMDLKSASAAEEARGDEDVEGEFSKRFPSLSGIEMVEREIGGSSSGGGRTMREI
ncbi:Ark- serine/threonine protein kinase [Saxophila tyrrhenica]|uniref:non-specific serine/threonine protein kinase n=1 Tax=Saxophila tyrrhenica TaxID=1690608 RepID=A0AAV9PIT8_9PEZI|nr:Ark- serine/threonine protein kinase [Saxophila tyrrhenica]